MITILSVLFVAVLGLRGSILGTPSVLQLLLWFHLIVSSDSVI
jgi:hypothetical protein